MKKGVVVSLLSVALVGIIFAQGQKKKSSAGHATATVSPEISDAAKAAAVPVDQCDAELWNHVYHKARLHVVQKCIEVTGVIHHTKKENDGDDHIQLTLDPKFEALLNERNNAIQAGSLVIEPVCQGPVTQADAVASCRDFHSPVTVPARGTKVRVVGSFVLDTEPDHGWTEIHPVSKMETVQ
jgi:hypothetical protein